MKAVAFESQPEINGLVEKLLIFFFSDLLITSSISLFIRFYLVHDELKYKYFYRLPIYAGVE